MRRVGVSMDNQAQNTDIRADSDEVLSDAAVRQSLAAAIKRSGKSREEIALSMSRAIGRTISVNMLNAYTSPARAGWRFPLAWIWAFCAATGDDALLYLLLSPRQRLLLSVSEHLASVRHLVGQLDEMGAAAHGARRLEHPDEWGWPHRYAGRPPASMRNRSCWPSCRCCATRDELPARPVAARSPASHAERLESMEWRRERSEGGGPLSIAKAIEDLSGNSGATAADRATCAAIRPP